MDDSGIVKSPFAFAHPLPVAVGLARTGAVIAVILGTFALLWPTTASLVVRWADTVSRSYTHGGLILLIACYLVWRRRGEIAAIAVRPSWVGCALTAALGLLWLVVMRAGVQIGHQALLPLVCFGLVWTIFGYTLLRRLWLPLGYLFFAIPVWDALNPPLQWVSAFAVRGLLSMLGIPVFFDGLEFQIPAGRFEIAGGCSGLHFFIVGLAIATLYGELHSDKTATRIKLLVLATMFALATNWIRIAIIIVAGHLTQMQHHLVSEEHYSFGWGMFAVAMAIFFLIVRRWPAAPVPAPPPALTTGRAVPLAGVALACAAIALPAIDPWIDGNVASSSAGAAHTLPAQVPGWVQGGIPAAPPPRFLNADITEARVYEYAGGVVEAYSAVYLQQMQGKELADFENRPLGESLAPVTGSAPAPEGWLAIRARDRAGRRSEVRVRYSLDGVAYAGLRRLQLDYGLASLTRNPVSAALVLRAPCTPGCDGARAALDRFTRDAHLANGSDAP